MINHEPPLPIRIALVSSTTALATPSFPVLGFIYVIIRLAVRDVNIRKAMQGRWGALLSFTTWTMLPTLYHGSVASLLLPCAIGNALVAGGLYGLIDVVTGGPSGQIKQLFNTPILSSGIGASVGYLAPHYVYGPVMELYGFEGMSRSISYMLNAPLATEVSIGTGLVAGMILHPMLYYPIHGISCVHWGYFSGLALAASTFGLYYIYYGRETVGLPVPEGSFISEKELDIANVVLRYNAKSGDVEAFSVRSGRFIGSEQQYLKGQQIVDSARLYQKNGNVVFDDRLLAFIYNYWDTTAKTRFHKHIVDLRSAEELKYMQDSLAITDAVVTVLLGKNRSSKSDKIAKSSMSSALEKICAIVGDNRRRLKQYMQSDMQDACIAIDLLMTLKSNPISDHTSSNLMAELEHFIRKTCPDAILYSSDESCDDTSIESQLKAAGWPVSSVNCALDRWELMCQRRTRATQKIIGISLVTGAIFSVVASVLIGSL